jgi:hypothetical protein
VGGPSLLVLTFAAPIIEGSNFATTLSSGTVSSTTVSGSTLSIALSGATDGQTLVVQLADVRDASTNASGTYSLDVGVLEGDVNGDGAVNATDVTDVKLSSGQPVTSSNFRDDIDANGAINSADITITKLKSGDSLAPSGDLLASAVTTTHSGTASLAPPVITAPPKTTTVVKRPIKKLPKPKPKVTPPTKAKLKKLDPSAVYSAVSRLLAAILPGSKGTK